MTDGRLFSGVGGFELGAKMVDIETVSNDDFLALNSPFFKVMTMFFNITKK